MTNFNHIKRLLGEIFCHLEDIRAISILAEREASFNQARKASYFALRELGTIQVEALGEAYDIKALYDRLHLTVVHLRCLRVRLEKCEEAAEAALEKAKIITGALEDGKEDDTL